MNKTIMTGRLTKDVEIRTTASDTKVAQFTLAVERPTSKDKEKQSDFFNIVAWGKLAELCGNYVKKGMKILVEGRFQVRNYDDKDGKRVYVTELFADNIEFLEKKEESEKPKESDFTPVDDSDLPF